LVCRKYVSRYTVGNVVAIAERRDDFDHPVCQHPLISRFVIEAGQRELCGGVHDGILGDGGHVVAYAGVDVDAAAEFELNDLPGAFRVGVIPGADFTYPSRYASLIRSTRFNS